MLQTIAIVFPICFAIRPGFVVNRFRKRNRDLFRSFLEIAFMQWYDMFLQGHQFIFFWPVLLTFSLTVFLIFFTDWYAFITANLSMKLYSFCIICRLKFLFSSLQMHFRICLLEVNFMIPAMLNCKFKTTRPATCFFITIFPAALNVHSVRSIKFS